MLTLPPMTLPRFLRSFILVFVLFLLLDSFWHMGVMADFYLQHLAPALRGTKPSLEWGIVALLGINAVTATYIVQSHIDQKRSVADILFVGALLGFTVSASINLLNLSILGWWDIILVLTDTAWGVVVGVLGAMAVLVTTPKTKKGIFGFLKRKKK